jgi:hypothetical protein
VGSVSQCEEFKDYLHSREARMDTYHLIGWPATGVLRGLYFCSWGCRGREAFEGSNIFISVKCVSQTSKPGVKRDHTKYNG